MTNDTINHAIKRAAGEGSNENYEEITYEGYGPNGVAIIVNATTDNRNRTAADIRHAFDKSGGSLGTSGCVSYMFNRKGIIIIEQSSTNMSEDELMMLALECGADDFEAGEDYYEISISPENFSAVREKLEENDLQFVEADIQMVPTSYIKLDEHGAEVMEKLLDRLDDLDDVSEVFHNWEE